MDHNTIRYLISGLWGAGIAQWLERRTHDRKVHGSSPGRSGGIIFFSSVSFLCWLLFRNPSSDLKNAYSRVCFKPVLNWANVCSPEHTSDTSTNYDSFLNWTFSSPNMVRTVQTLLHSQLACNEMQASARTCGRQHDRKCRLKSSQYTLIIPHRVIQLTTISFWDSETRLRLPQVNK